MKVGSVFRWSLVALASAVMPSTALAQAYANEIPGLGAGIQPKVMIILDTSNSMRHLPDFNIASGASPPAKAGRSPDGGPGYDYFDDDFNSGAPGDFCDNRFCIAKRTFYNILDNYSDDIQMGLAGYYQYRTEYIAPAGVTQCLYDVLAPAGREVVIPNQDTLAYQGWHVPPGQDTMCVEPAFGDGGIHLYNIGIKNTYPGAPVSCVAHNNFGSGNLAAPGQPLNGRCSSDVPLTPTLPPTLQLSGGASVPANSNLWVRLAKGATCPAPGSTVLYRGGSSFTAGSPTPQGLSSVAGPGFTNIASFTGQFAWLAACNTSATCRLIYTDAGTLGTETTAIAVYADAGTTFTNGPRTFNFNTFVANRGFTRAAASDAGCEWADGTPASPGDDRIVTSTAGYSGGGVNCSTASGPGATTGQNCRMAFINRTPGSNSGTYQPPAMTQTRYHSWSQPPSVTGTCSVDGSLTQTLNYGSSGSPNATRTITVTAQSMGGSCPASPDLTSNPSGATWSGGGAFTCTGSAPCELRSMTTVAIVDPATYRAPIVPPDPKVIRAGYPQPGGTLQHGLTAYGQVCPGGGTVGSTFLFANGSPGCSSPNGCLGTFNYFDPTGGGRPGDDLWYSATIPSYTVDGGVYTHSGIVTTSSADSEYVHEKTGPSCPSNVTLTSGTLFGKECSPARPCDLTYRDEYCTSISTGALVTCPGGTDTTVRRFCGYDASLHRYTPTNYGSCHYTLQQYKYEEPGCRYSVRRWDLPAPGCSVPTPGTCNFRIVENRYTYSDPNTYCQAYAEEFEYTGATASRYDLSYLTKGGEYLGSVTMPSSYGSLSARNWCELGSYAAFQNDCPAVITPSTPGFSSMPDTIRQACGSWPCTDCECRLRWRSPADAGSGAPVNPCAFCDANGNGDCETTTGECSPSGPHDCSSCDTGVVNGQCKVGDGECVPVAGPGGYAAHGRLSYYAGGVATEGMSPDPLGVLPYSTPRPMGCLAPDRAGGEVATPSASALLVNDNPTTHRSFNGGGFTFMSADDADTTAQTNVPPGRYTLRIPARQDSGGPACAAMTVMYRLNSGAWTNLAVNVPVCNTSSLAEYTFDLTIPSTSTFRANISFTNDYCCGGGDRNLIIGGPIRLDQKVEDFCSASGLNAPSQVRLRSDWYDPSRPNAITQVPFADTWTNHDRKYSGWSRHIDGGPGDTFVPMGTGSTHLSSFIQPALDRCVRPTDLTSPATGGLCWADTENCGPTGLEACVQADAGMSDFTPLFGALTNAQDYLAAELASDGEHLCRDYYVLMVSDGLEATPRGYTQADLQNAVQSLRTTTSGARTKDVKTFVVGFGAIGGSDAGASDLDIIARAGGTAGHLNAGGFTYDLLGGRALSAQQESELTQVLNIIFTSIIPGRFARSRPAITPSTLNASGNRIYQAYFERGVNTAVDAGHPEWRGNMVAFETDATGLLAQRWDLRSKLDVMPAPARTLRAVVSGNLENFTTSNTALHGPIGGTTAEAQAAIRFARNDTRGAHADETFRPIPISRESRLGAFVFSTPVPVGKSAFAAGYGGKSSETARGSYETFQDNVLGRPMRVLVGSNDGFWRAIRDGSDAGVCATDESNLGCSNGTEAWGIVPETVLPNLRETRLGATPMVDGTTAVADVCWPSTGNDARDCAVSDWRTVAITSFRHGGDGWEAFELSNTGGLPTPLWRFTDSDQGYSYAPPTMARIMFQGEARWVAIGAGGLRHGFDDGDGIYVMNVETGSTSFGGDYGKFTNPIDGESLVARQTLFKRYIPDQVDVETAYFPSTWGRIWAMRIQDDVSDIDDLEPQPWFDPWGRAEPGNPPLFTDAFAAPPGSAAADLLGNGDAPVFYLDKATGDRVDSQCRLWLGTPGASNTALRPPHRASINNCGELGTPRPFWSSATLVTNHDPTGNRPDLFIGTGDAIQLDDLTERNYFFALHDQGFDPANKAASTAFWGARPLWLYTFDPGEKIINQPTLVGGSLVLSTFTPPTTGSLCLQRGDSWLYAFNPADGTPRAVLFDQTSGTHKSVIKCADCGPLSQAIAVGGRLFFSDSSGAVGSVDVKPVGVGGRVQGWRRIK